MLAITRQDPITRADRARDRRSSTCSCFIVLLTSFRRSRLGVAGVRGESMLVDLRDRILSQGGIPTLPAGWLVESALRSAGGTPFAGDFVVSAGAPDADRLEIVVVDVSGKGEQAGTRALLLSGAFGGLLGALPPADFLPAANDYLLRQDWEEGFATADPPLPRPRSPAPSRCAPPGHPPAAQLDAGSGRWTVLRGRGAGARADRGRRVHDGRRACCARATRCCSTPTAWSRRRGATSASASTGCSARPRACCAASFEGGADRLVDALGSPQRRPGPGAGPPPLSGGRPGWGRSPRDVARLHTALGASAPSARM